MHICTERAYGYQRALCQMENLKFAMFRKIALDEAIKAGLTKFNVFLDKNMFADVITCANAEIKIDQKVDFQVDGEYMGEVDHLKISIVPAAIPVLIG